MFHTNALFAPATGYEQSMAAAKHARELAAQMKRTGQRKAYYAGRERTAAEWIAFAEYHERRLDY